jgi:hypothetical protein
MEYRNVDKSIMTEELLSLIPNRNKFATPDAIYTIKCSHAGWDIKWEKTKADILYLKRKGCKILPELHKELVAMWKVKHGNKSFLSLKSSKTMFFDDNVTYVYNHDYLHELVAAPGTPIYKDVLMKDEQVMVDKDKFNALPFDRQVRMFREEVAVIACERWLINPVNRGKFSLKQAWNLSLKKTITNLTKGWATDFIVHNLEHFVQPGYKDFEILLHKLNIQENIMAVDMKVFEELKKAVGNEETMDDFVCALAEDCLYGASAFDKIKTEFGYELLQEEGGGEGGAEYCYGVFSLKGKTYKAEFSYFSYDGNSTNGCANSLKEVTPVIQKVTVWT